LRLLKPKIPDSVFQIPGYILLRNDRTGTKRGGGILAYVNNKLKTTRRFEREEKKIEILWLDVLLFNSKIVF